MGDITKINGAEIEPVDVITGGSPCQDLSVAGKMAGLAGERSGLFMEQIRIIKEMRDAEIRSGRTGQSIRPRYCVWENVPGALSSNGGRDFQSVLTAFVRVADPDAPAVPLPEKGRWQKWGGYMGTGPHGIWSVAWRIHDAQFWGVPQRRRRICVLADYGGWTAHRILFDFELRGEAEEGNSDEAEPCFGEEPGRKVHAQREGVSGDSEPGGAAGQEAAGDAGGCAYPAVANTLSRRYDGSPQPDRQIGANIVAITENGNCDVRLSDVTNAVTTGGEAGAGLSSCADRGDCRRILHGELRTGSLHRLSVGSKPDIAWR